MLNQQTLTYIIVTRKGVIKELVFKDLLESYPSCTAIVFSQYGFGNKSKIRSYQKLLYEKSLRYLFVKLWEELWFSAKKKIGLVYSLEKAGRKANIPILFLRDVHESSFLKFIKEKKIDLIINFGGQIYKKAILELPTFGCVNIHFSLLPRYKGWAGDFWAVNNGDNVAGITVHQMEDSIDTGNILIQDSISINCSNTVYEVQRKLLWLANNTLGDIFDRATQRDFRTPLIPNEESWVKIPTPEDVHTLHKKNKKLITIRQFLFVIFDRYRDI